MLWATKGKKSTLYVSEAGPPINISYVSEEVTMDWNTLNMLTIHSVASRRDEKEQLQFSLFHWACA